MESVQSTHACCLLPSSTCSVYYTLLISIAVVQSVSSDGSSLLWAGYCPPHNIQWPPPYWCAIESYTCRSTSRHCMGRRHTIKHVQCTKPITIDAHHNVIDTGIHAVLYCIPTCWCDVGWQVNMILLPKTAVTFGGYIYNTTAQYQDKS